MRREILETKIRSLASPEYLNKEIIGELISKRSQMVERDGHKEETNVYELLFGDMTREEYWGFVELDKKMRAVAIGQIVYLTYLGKEKVGNKDWHRIKVEVED